MYLNKVERLGESLIKRRILTKVVRRKDDINQFIIDCVIENFSKPARVTRYTGVSDLALSLRLGYELVPLRVIESGLVVHRVIEIHLDMVRLQTT